MFVVEDLNSLGRLGNRQGLVYSIFVKQVPLETA